MEIFDDSRQQIGKVYFKYHAAFGNSQSLRRVDDSFVNGGGSVNDIHRDGPENA